MTPLRRTALVAGLLYLATFVAGIPPSFLYGPVLTDPSAVLTAGNDGQILWGVFLDLCTGMAGIGTAVALYSVVKRQHEGAADRFVTTRVIEGAMLFIAGLSMLTLVSVRQAAASASNPATLTAIGQTLIDVRNGAHLLGPGLMPPFNACLLGLPDVPLRARPAMDADARTHRGAAAVLVQPRNTVRRQRPDVGLDRDRDHPDLHLGAVDRAVHDGQGLPTRRPAPRRAPARPIPRCQDGRGRSLNVR